MDPQVVWNLLVDAYADQDVIAARDAASDLLVWLQRGGFPPQTMPGRILDESWNRSVAAAVCETVLALRRDAAE